MVRLGARAAWIAATAATALLAGCGAMQANGGGQGAELRIRKVVLFQNGVGYFERKGTIEGDRLELRVRPDQINDVLKSLTILHLSDGRTASVTMPVEQSADRLSAQLPASVREARGLVGLLQVLRGVEVTVEADGDDVRGRVVGVEGAGKHGKGDKNNATVTLMVGDKKLVTLPVRKVDKVRIHDRALAAGLARSLDISRSEGQWKPVGLTVHMDRSGSHELLVGYIHEVPIWRPAYRAWVEKGHGVRLQGWAVVDNVSGEDWRNVRLSLVVGSPLSFRYELHKPHHVTRPDLSSRLPQTANAPPPPDVGYGDAPAEMLANDEEGGAAMDDADEAPRKMMKERARSGRASPKPSMAGGMRPMAKMAPSAPAPAPAMEPDVDLDTRRQALARSAQAMAEGKKMGQLYRYDALAPVTVHDGQAALVHIVDKKVEGADVFLFRNASSGETPFRSLLVRNPKGSALESGPITLYVDGTFAGEGFLGRIDEDATTFIPFAAADGFALTPQTESRNADIHLVRASGGRMTIESKHRMIRKITIKSERDEPSTCYVKVVLNGSMTLEAPPKGMIRAGGEVYLPIEVPAKGVGSVEISEVSTQTRVSTSLDSYVLEAFQLALKNTTLEESVKGPIRELLATQDKLGELQRKRNELQQQRYELERDAQRIRNNLDSLPLDKVADKLRKTLVDQLEANTRKAAEVAKSTVELDVEMAALREKIAQLIKQLELK